MNHDPRSPCPYCGDGVRDTRDHVFPEFLGGTRTIFACKECNDIFGHAAEGPVSHDLAPFFVQLRMCGIQAPCFAVWRKAVVREETQWDLDTELVMRPSKPDFSSPGRAVFPSAKSAKAFAKHYGHPDRAEQGKAGRVNQRKGPPIQLNTTSFSLEIGRELRQVAMKICVAVADCLGMGMGILDVAGRDFLLGRAENRDRARIDWAIHPTLEALRTPLSHLVFVKGNASTHRCYGVAQFYGAFQLQLILNEKDYCGDNFACLGRLDPVASYAEIFGTTDLLLIPEAPLRLEATDASARIGRWSSKFSDECQAAFPDRNAAATMRLES